MGVAINTRYQGNYGILSCTDKRIATRAKIPGTETPYILETLPFEATEDFVGGKMGPTEHMNKCVQKHLAVHTYKSEADSKRDVTKLDRMDKDGNLWKKNVMMADFKAPPIDLLRDGIQFFGPKQDPGKSFLITDIGGCGRSGTFLVAFLLWLDREYYFGDKYVTKDGIKITKAKGDEEKRGDEIDAYEAVRDALVAVRKAKPYLVEKNDQVRVLNELYKSWYDQLYEKGSIQAISI